MIAACAAQIHNIIQLSHGFLDAGSRSEGLVLVLTQDPSPCSPAVLSLTIFPEVPASITDALACRGLEKVHFRQFLQCWALLQMEPLYKVAQDIAPALSKPPSQVMRSQQVYSCH